MFSHSFLIYHHYFSFPPFSMDSFWVFASHSFPLQLYLVPKVVQDRSWTLIAKNMKKSETKFISSSNSQSFEIKSLTPIFFNHVHIGPKNIPSWKCWRNKIWRYEVLNWLKKHVLRSTRLHGKVHYYLKFILVSCIQEVLFIYLFVSYFWCSSRQLNK